MLASYAPIENKNKLNNKISFVLIAVAFFGSIPGSAVKCKQKSFTQQKNVNKDQNLSSKLEAWTFGLSTAFIRAGLVTTDKIDKH